MVLSNLFPYSLTYRTFAPLLKESGTGDKAFPPSHTLVSTHCHQMPCSSLCVCVYEGGWGVGGQSAQVYT